MTNIQKYWLLGSLAALLFVAWWAAYKESHYVHVSCWDRKEICTSIQYLASTYNTPINRHINNICHVPNHVPNYENTSSVYKGSIADYWDAKVCK